MTVKSAPAGNMETRNFEMSKTAVAKTDPNGVPDYLKGRAPIKSNDNFDASDVVIPRIKLLQGLSKELEVFDAAQQGHFWHTGMDISLGEELVFIPCARNKKYLLIAPMDDGQGVLARADDFKTWNRLGEWEVVIDKKRKITAKWAIKDLNVHASGLDQWGTSEPGNEDSPPAATLFYDYLVICPDHLDLGPSIISLGRSQVKKARKGLNDKIDMQQSNGRPMQALRFKATCFTDHNSSNQDFKNWQFYMDGFATEELFKQADGLKDMLANYVVQDETDTNDQGTEAETDKF